MCSGQEDATARSDVPGHLRLPRGRPARQGCHAGVSSTQSPHSMCSTATHYLQAFPCSLLALYISEVTSAAIITIQTITIVRRYICIFSLFFLVESKRNIQRSGQIISMKESLHTFVWRLHPASTPSRPPLFQPPPFPSSVLPPSVPSSDPQRRRPARHPGSEEPR